MLKRSRQLEQECKLHYWEYGEDKRRLRTSMSNMPRWGGLRSVSRISMCRCIRGVAH